MNAMKKTWVLMAGIICLAGIVLQFSSCGKEKSTPPNISFSTDTTRYISKDTSLLHGTVFTVGIQASKTGTEGLLASLVISRSRNGGADSIIQNMTFVEKYFFQYYSYKAPDSGNMEHYTFTVAKQDGLTNSIGLSITGI
jgi:hypothetical protein